MFKRALGKLGKLDSGDGFSVAFAHKSVRYIDPRGEFELGFEDGYLFPPIRQVSGDRISLTDAESDIILTRVQDGLASEGHRVRIHGRS